MAESDYANRQRLRPWLIAQINSGQIAGLCWMNDEQTKFRIPWKHAGKQDWNPSYSQIFTVTVENFFFLYTVFHFWIILFKLNIHYLIGLDIDY